MNGPIQNGSWLLLWISEMRICVVSPKDPIQIFFPLLSVSNERTPGAFKIINCSWFCKCSLRFQWQNEVSKRSIIVEHVRVEPFRMLWRSIEANSRGPRGGIGRRGWNRNSNFIECFSSLLFSLSLSFLFLQCSLFFFLGWNNFNIFFPPLLFSFIISFSNCFAMKIKFLLYCWIFNLWSFFYE